MKFKNFTFKLTSDCNFSCNYCSQKQSKEYLDNPDIEAALDFFYPYLESECYINFYGGEPLLAFPSIKKIVGLIRTRNQDKDKRIRYTISTNGTLVDNAVLEFFSRNEISPLLSFDGTAQEISRKKGTFDSTLSVIKKLLKTEQDFIVNSVFTPETVDHLSDSMRLLIEMGVLQIGLTLSTLSSWEDGALAFLQEELGKLRRLLVTHYRNTSTLPIQNYLGSSGKGVFACAAGRDRMVLTPAGTLWGCHLFANYYDQVNDPSLHRHYCFGDLNTFIEQHAETYPRILGHHSFFSMECFSSGKEYCLFCPEMEDCGVCPVYGAFVTHAIGDIPTWTCKIKKIMREEVRIFRQETGQNQQLYS